MRQGSGNSITLDTTTNNFTGAVLVESGNDVTLVDADALLLGASTVSGSLTVTVTLGDITDTGTLDVTGDASFTASASGADIVLDDASNRFDGSVAFASSGGLADLAFVDTSALELPSVTLTGNLNVTAGGAITDSGTLAVTGTSTLAAGSGNSITLDTTTNNLTGSLMLTSPSPLAKGGAREGGWGLNNVSGGRGVAGGGRNKGSKKYLMQAMACGSESSATLGVTPVTVVA